jgi:hypothetical protein
LRKHADPDKKNNFRRFFKTALGQYGHGDIFLGVTVPKIRMIVKEYNEMPLSQVKIVLNSKIHEERLAALLILVCKYSGGDLSSEKGRLILSCQSKKNQQLGSCRFIIVSDTWRLHVT